MQFSPDVAFFAKNILRQQQCTSHHAASTKKRPADA